MLIYHTILVPLDTTDADRTILDHVTQLARAFGSRLILLHVADGWAARRFGPDAISAEITADKEYLATMAAELRSQGFEVETEMAFGNPAKEIIRWVDKRHCDLIAMTTHGHRFLADMVFGTTAHQLQHKLTVPILLLKVKR